MPDVRWPNGFTEFYYKVKLHKKKILEGTLVAVDPASGGSSLPGFAIFEAGIQVFSGVIDIPKKLPIEQRLRVLSEKIGKLTTTPPDIFAIELIRGRFAHVHLFWAVGSSIAGCNSETVLEVPIAVWKAVSKVDTDYTKSDAADAAAIGKALVLLAQRD